MATVFLLLGTNLGDLAGNLAEASALLEESFGPCVAASPTVQTEAVGFTGPDFFNRVEVYRTRRHPRTVLGICKEIERKMGRTGQPEYAPDGSRIYRSRIIDIDILEYRRASDKGKPLTVSTPDLTLPHPQIEGRPFVRPLLDMALNQTFNR